MISLYHSDAKFADIVKDKIGNVREFKKNLREAGLIEPQKQFSNEHVALFERVRDLRREWNSNWNEPIKHVIAEYAAKLAAEVSASSTKDEFDLAGTLKDISADLKQILAVLKQIANSK